MALTYDQISAITSAKFIPKLIDNIFDSDPLLQRLNKKSKVKLDGGEKVITPLNYAQNSASDWYSGADTLNTTDNDVITGAAWNWKQLYANISITRADELKNSGDSAIINFVKSKVQIAEKTLIDKLQDGLYSTGTNAKSIIGIPYIVDDANTVGGISQSTYSWWQSEVDDATTTFGLSTLQTCFNNTSLNNEHVSVILATRANYNRYFATLLPQQRFMDSETAKGGFQSLMYSGVPFISGSKVPTSHIIGLNEAYLTLGVHKDEDMRFEPFAKPTGQNIKLAKIYWMGIFGSTNNRMHFKMSAVAA